MKPQSSGELAQRLFDPLSGVYLRDHKVGGGGGGGGCWLFFF